MTVVVQQSPSIADMRQETGVIRAFIFATVEPDSRPESIR